MKNLIFTLYFIFGYSLLLFSQTVSPMNLFVDGLQTTFTKYNEVGVIKNQINSTHNNITRSGQNTSVNSNTIFTDVNSITLFTRDFGYKLNINSLSGGQSFFIDMKYFLPVTIANQFKNYTLTATGNAYEVPSQLTAGMILNSIRINYNFTPNVSGFSSSTTSVSFMNRTVINREKVTTPSGTYMCWKITEDCEIRNNTITKQKITRWISNDFGLVKTETKDTSGNLIETDVLTRFQFPNILNSK